MEKVDINPLAASQQRRLWSCPPHFTQVVVDFESNNIVNSATRERHLRWWLYENIEGRFYLGDMTINDGRMIMEKFIVAFENPSDATWFSLTRDIIINKIPNRLI